MTSQKQIREITANPRSIQSHSEQAPYYKYRVPYSHKMFSDICEFLHIGSSSIVMDAGCGTGHVTEHLVKYAGQVHAVDGSTEMIRHAEKFSNATHYTSDLNVEKFIVPGGVDHIFFGRCIHHFPATSVNTLVVNNLRETGALITCSSEWFPQSGWWEPYLKVKNTYEDDEGITGQADVTGRSNLPEIGFYPRQKFTHQFGAAIDVHYLSRLTLARAYRKTLRNLLRNFKEFENNLSEALNPFLLQGKLPLVVRSWAYVWKRGNPSDMPDSLVQEDR